MDKSHARLATVILDADAGRLTQLTGLLRSSGLALATGASTIQEATSALGNAATPGLIVICVDASTSDVLGQMQSVAKAAPGTRLLIHSSKPADILESLQALAADYGLVPIGVLPMPATAQALVKVVARASFEEDVDHHDDAPAFTDSDIEDAFARNLFEPWFQPKLEIRTGRIIGVEALLRWRLPDGTTRLPRVFLPRLEALGLARDVTLRTMTCAAECINLIVGRTKDFSVSINVTPSLLDDPLFVDDFHRTIVDGGARADQIIVEIVESALREPSQAMMENLTRLRMLDFRVSIDNYLVGGSSLTQVITGPFSEWKLAGVHTSQMQIGSRLWNLVEATVQLARKIGVHTVAGGVETPSQMEALLHMGCDTVQGFMIAPPMPILEFMQWMDARTRGSVTDVSSFMLTGQFESTVIDRRPASERSGPRGATQRK